MRLGQITINDRRRVVRVEDTGQVSLLDFPGDMRDLVASATPLRDIPVERVLDPATGLEAPIAPPKVVAIGLNYLDHVRETGMNAPTSPLIFAKFPSTVIGPDDTIEIDRSITARVDWEAELAVVVGSAMRHVDSEDALSHVFGYTAGNDVSARDVQFGDGQWIRGKNLETFCPLGPVIVTPDEIGDVQALAISTKVNGELLQDSSTKEMIFGVAELLSYCSHQFALEPGDVVLTGTPWGCGEFMTPQRSLNDGDIVEVEVDGIGRLRNPVVVTRG
jgi:5-carboxymethyl-2-hydroxymuconate isomerase